MNPQRIILVIGATGAQGGSVAKALLSDKKFGVRILTRNPQSPAAITLQRQGAEIAEGSLDNFESLQQAMQGVYGVFGVTNYWEHFDKEYQLGKNLIDAVKSAGVKHFVFSTLDDYNKLSHGKFSVAHYDIKAQLAAYAKSVHLPVSFVQMSFYYENFFSFFQLQKDEDGHFFFGFPQGDTPLATTSVEDAGRIVAAIFDHPRQYIGRTVRVVGEDSSCRLYAGVLAEILEQPIYFKHIPHDEYAQQNFAGAKELADMFEVQRLYIPSRQLDLIESYGLNTGMQTFRQWVIKNKEKFLQHYGMHNDVAA